LFVVDAGNLLFGKNSPTEADELGNTSALIVAHGLVRAYTAMAYDAVGVSPVDLSAGADFFLRTKGDSFPWVAANIYTKNDEQWFAPHIVKTSGHLTIGIIGLTGDAKRTLENFVIRDWREALHTEIAELTNQCDMLIVLSSLNPEENLEILQKFNQIDIIVTADHSGVNIPPKVALKSLLVQSGGRGKYIGKLDVIWQDEGNWFPMSSQSPIQQKARLGAIDRELSKLNRQQLEAKKDLSRKIARLQVSRDRIIKQIEEMTKKSVINGAQPTKGYRASFLPVQPVNSATPINTIVSDIKKSINALNRMQRANLRAADTANRLLLQSNEIAGSFSCRECHSRQADFWRSTKHAKAYTTLTRQGQSFNLKCLPCHVTAGKIRATSTESEKLLLLSLSADRRAVGCEVCHGPSRDHLLSPDQNLPIRRPAREICVQCHTPERDDHFDYQEKIAAIACPKG